MPTNIFEQFDEIYSRWSIMDKVGKEMQMERMWQNATAAYRYLLQVYQGRGYLTLSESNYAKQIGQMMTELQNQKMKVDQELTNEMLKHLVKMKVKQRSKR